MDKKGLEHIEVILSFVLFIGFLGFAFYYFSPLIFEQNNAQHFSDDLIYELKSDAIVYDLIINNTSNALNNYTGMIAVNISGEEGYFQNPNAVPFPDKYIVEAVFHGDINVTPDFKLTTVFYKIASIKNIKIISEKSIKDLSIRYSENYTLVKENLNFDKEDFGFRVELTTGQISAEKEIPYGREVSVENKRVNVLRENGKIEDAKMEIIKW